MSNTLFYFYVNLGYFQLNVFFIRWWMILVKKINWYDQNILTNNMLLKIQQACVLKVFKLTTV